MHSLKPVLLTAVFITAFACGSTNPVLSDDDLIGTWQLVSVDGQPVSELTEEPFETIELTFRMNGTFEDVVTVMGEREVDVGSWTLVRDRLMTTGSAGLLQEVTVRVDGNRLFIVTLQGQTFEYERTD